MAKCAQRLTIFSFFSAFLLLAAITPIYGGGSLDADLSRAEEHIKNLEYDEAITILSDFARRNPDQFDKAQQRLRRIYQIRDEFNRTADELISTLINDPENNEKVLALSRHLYTLEHEDSPLMVNFVARTREIAQFNVNRNMLRRILERGRILLDRGDSIAALQTYAEGMVFMRDEFFAAGFGTNIENDVRRETERVDSVIAAFQQTSAPLGAISAEYVRAINAGELTRVPEITNRLIPAMERFTVQKQGLYTSVNTFDRILHNIRVNNPETGDRNHLAFVSVVIHGRSGESIQEGMLGAFDTYWQNSIGSIIDAIAAHVERGKNASIAAINAGNFTAAAAAVDRMVNFVNLTPFFFDRHRQLHAGASSQTITLYGNNILRLDIPPYIEIRALNEANNILLQAANIGIRQAFDRSTLIRWQEGRITTADALRTEQQTRNSINEIQRTINIIRTNGNQLNAEMNSFHTVRHITDALEAVENMYNSLLAEERFSAQRYYVIAHHNLQNSLSGRREQLENSRNFLEGERHTSPDGIVTVFRYPAEALQELTVMLSASEIDLSNANSVLEQYRNEPAEIAAVPEIANTNANYLAAMNELNNIRTQGLALMETARTRSTQAETYRLEGDRLFREAQAAFQRRDFDTARDRIQRASDRLNDSLEIQESASLRAMRDTQLMSLGQAIAIAENETIIVEVRNLVNTARNAYFNGNFQQAEDSLVRARNRWRITSPIENEEVLYWLGIVRTALSMSSGRVIHPTAPLYPEMSQLLSQAQRNFEEGTRNVNAGDRAAGLARFDEARQLAREVRLMFPMNQEAGILDLRIEQFLDPAAFNASFEQRLRNAIAGTRNRSMESFADLQNLAEINPRYPNIRNILTQAEIDMGIRPPPPNPANIARSRELTASANRIMESNLTAQYEVAHEQLNEAIRLNPENIEASRVRDRLLGRMSVPGSIVLSSEDEADYQRALRELNAGNNLVAFALVERIMQNPNNRNITKVIELQRRIQSVL